MSHRLTALAATAGLLLTVPAAPAQHDPNAYSSLGTLNVTSGTLVINTDTLAMSAAATFTGVAVTQTNGPMVAVFTFDSINLGGTAAISVSGTRPLVLLSRGTATLTRNFTVPAIRAGGSSSGSAGVSLAVPGAGQGGGGAFSGLDPRAGGGGFGGAGGGAGPLGSAGVAYGNLYADLPHNVRRRLTSPWPLPA
jgi:hypothetical protein